MMLVKALACSLLTAATWIQAVQAQESPVIISTAIVTTPELPGRPASTCGTNTTSCGGIGVGTVTVNIGPIKTDTTTATSVVTSTFTKVVTRIIPTISTRVRSSKGLCNLITTKTISTPITRVVTETTTTTSHRVVDTTTIESRIYYEDVDPVDDCIIPVNDVGVGIAQPGAPSTASAPPAAESGIIGEPIDKDNEL